MPFKIHWASLIVGRKFTVFALFYFVFEGNFPSTSPRGLIFGGAILRRVFCVTGLGGFYLEGLIHGGGYFRNFTVSLLKKNYRRSSNLEILPWVSLIRCQFFGFIKVKKEWLSWLF